MMQYFVRKVLRNESSPVINPWQKFATYVQTPAGSLRWRRAVAFRGAARAVAGFRER
jgi:hypothetical protein